MQEAHNAQTRSHIIYDPDLIATDPARLFFPDAQSTTANHTTAGSTVVFTESAGYRFALKSYARRGFMARFLKESYAWRPFRRSRMWHEFALLHQLHQLGLPVPRPAAALCQYRTCYAYTGKLLTERIPNAPNLRDLLQRTTLPADRWREIGRTIARFHRAGLWHNDLVAGNILVQDMRHVWLIDFDKCAFRAPRDSWKRANLARIRHSLRKLARKHAVFHFSENDWTALLDGFAE